MSKIFRKEDPQITTSKLIEIREILRPIRHLCDEDREWEGYINLFSCKIESCKKGGTSHCFRSLLSSEQIIQGERGFHVHPGGCPPSFSDVCTANLAGCAEYIVTKQGIYEIEPNKFPIYFPRLAAQVLENFLDNESLKMHELQRRNGITTFLARHSLCNPPSEGLAYLAEKAFPVKINFISW